MPPGHAACLPSAWGGRATPPGEPPRGLRTTRRHLAGEFAVDWSLFSLPPWPDGFQEARRRLGRSLRPTRASRSAARQRFQPVGRLLPIGTDESTSFADTKRRVLSWQRARCPLSHLCSRVVVCVKFNKRRIAREPGWTGPRSGGIWLRHNAVPAARVPSKHA